MRAARAAPRDWCRALRQTPSTRTANAVGFANPALYRLDGGAAIHDVLPIDAENPPTAIGAQPFFGSADNYLTTLGEDSSLAVTRGYDEVTGIGAATSALVTAFRKCS